VSQVANKDEPRIGMRMEWDGMPVRYCYQFNVSVTFAPFQGETRFEYSRWSMPTSITVASFHVIRVRLNRGDPTVKTTRKVNNKPLTCGVTLSTLHFLVAIYAAALCASMMS